METRCVHASKPCLRGRMQNSCECTGAFQFSRVQVSFGRWLVVLCVATFLYSEESSVTAQASNQGTQKSSRSILFRFSRHYVHHEETWKIYFSSESGRRRLTVALTLLGIGLTLKSLALDWNAQQLLTDWERTGILDPCLGGWSGVTCDNATNMNVLTL